MRVTKLVSFADKEVEIVISTEDIRAAIEEEPEDVRPAVAMQGLNSLAKYLRAISEQTIAAMTDSQRAVVRDFLQAQAERYQ